MKFHRHSDNITFFKCALPESSIPTDQCISFSFVSNVNFVSLGWVDNPVRKICSMSCSKGSQRFAINIRDSDKLNLSMVVRFKTQSNIWISLMLKVVWKYYKCYQLATFTNVMSNHLIHSNNSLHNLIKISRHCTLVFFLTAGPWLTFGSR
jgi:hypothetical protein